MSFLTPIPCKWQDDGDNMVLHNHLRCCPNRQRLDDDGRNTWFWDSSRVSFPVSLTLPQHPKQIHSFASWESVKNTEEWERNGNKIKIWVFHFIPLKSYSGVATTTNERMIIIIMTSRGKVFQRVSKIWTFATELTVIQWGKKEFSKSSESSSDKMNSRQLFTSHRIYQNSGFFAEKQPQKEEAEEEAIFQ